MAGKYKRIRKGVRARISGRDRLGRVDTVDVKFGRLPGMRVKLTQLERVGLTLKSLKRKLFG